MNTEYGTACFDMTVSKSGDLTYGPSKDFTKIPDKCKDKNNTELTHYRFYLADIITGHGLACYEGVEESCKQLNGSNPAAPAPAGGAAGSTIVGDPYTDTTSVACDPRTREVGIADGYVDSKLFKVRLCSLSNLTSTGDADNPGGSFSTPGADGHAIVNSRVSGAWFTLVSDAASAGAHLSATSSFRSMPQQQSLWAQNPDPQSVAPPGTSSHQAGVAIDFANMDVKGGPDCATRARSSDPGWQWLFTNAEKYGFKQYSAEAWHWDALPAANRCGFAS
jgi:hypothetical protein